MTHRDSKYHLTCEGTELKTAAHKGTIGISATTAHKAHENATAASKKIASR